MKDLNKDKPEGEHKMKHGSSGKDNLKKDKYEQDSDSDSNPYCQICSSIRIPVHEQGKT